MLNKKVLLRERKRYNARRVASARYAVPVGVPPPPPSLDLVWTGAYPFPGLDEGGGALGWGTPCLDLGRGTPHRDLGRGYPPEMLTDRHL